MKVLITGPWLESSSDYSCFFDHISVPAALIQPGVLRCYCPAHDTGLVMLQVAMGGEVISSSVVFEYKARDLPALPSSQHDWLSLDDTQFRMSILERLEQMEQRMSEISNPSPAPESSAAKGGGAEGGATEQLSSSQSFEGRVVVLCEQMMVQSCWGSGSELVHSRSSRGMTLLHLAAAQGYSQLIQTLRRWRSKHSDSIDLELEVDPLNVDHFSCTPLMWACALGHTEAASVLFEWDHRALSIPDSLGRLPLNIARSRGHTRLAELLEQLLEQPQQTPPSSNSQRAAATSRGQQRADTGDRQPESDTGVKTEHQADSKSRHQSRPQGAGPQEDPSPPKRPKPSSEPPPGQQLAPLPAALSTLSSLLSPSRQPRAPLLLVRTAGLASAQRGPRRMMGKERLALHLRHRVVCERGDTELLSVQEHTDDMQMDVTLMDHLMETSSERLKQEPMETDAECRGAGLSGCLSDVKRFLSPSPPSSLPRLSSLSGEQPPQPCPSARFLCGARKDTGLSLSEPERAELSETIRRALLALRKKKGPVQEQRKEIAAVIQRCYKRYKQYALYKRMTLAAVLIQSRFRSLMEQKKFQQSRRAAVLIQQYYRSYRHSLSRLLSKKQSQAARKILRFLLRCRHSPMLDHRPLKQGQRAEKGQGS